jgi:hypothetical protein
MQQVEGVSAAIREFEHGSYNSAVFDAVTTLATALLHQRAFLVT